MNRPARRFGLRILRSESGMVDLKSTIAATVLGAVIALSLGAIIFGLIPWMWDKAAISDLEAVKTAESASISKEGRYFDAQGLTEKGYLQDPQESVEVTTNTKGTCFAAVAESRTGKKFFIADWTDDAHEVTPAVRFVNGCAEQVIPDLMSWGYNGYGQLGTGDTQKALKAVSVQLDADEDIFTVASGNNHSCAATAAEVWCWGLNSSGQLGDGTRQTSKSPVKVAGLPEGEVTSLATGAAHTCAAVDGGIWCWGYNSYNQTSQTASYSQPAPMQVKGLPGAAVTVTAGENHTCTISESDVYCWGYNGYGQLGDGTISTHKEPAKVGALTLQHGATSVTAGEKHTCAVVSGDAWCWGNGSSGQLGNGKFSSQRSPVQVSGMPAGSVSAVATGRNHSCAISSAEAWCWGENTWGQLGGGATTNRATAAKVAGLPADSEVEFLGAGYSSSCAATGNSVWCWGANTTGQLGDGTAKDSRVPSKVMGLIGTEPITALGVGSSHVVVAMGGAGLIPGQAVDRPYKFPVFGFGSSANGQLGTGGVSSSSIPVPAEWKPGTRVYSPTAGTSHSCALTANEAWCWGNNTHGQLGDGTTTQALKPVKVQGLPEGTISSITAGDNHTCALVDDVAWCWGYGANGELGNGTTNGQLKPGKVSGLTGVTSLSAGGQFTCAVASGQAYCWGYNYKGQLGNGRADFERVATPNPVYGIPLGKKVQSVTAGKEYACAIVSEASDLWCWGDNTQSQLGDGTQTGRLGPVKVNLPGPVSQIAAGSSHTCAVANTTFDLYCWGRSDSGQVGTAIPGQSFAMTPAQVPGQTGVTAVTVGSGHTCAIVGLETWCWGIGTSGQTGTGTAANTPEPSIVRGLPSGKPVTAIAAGGSHTIVIVDGLPAAAPAPVTDDKTRYPLKSWGLNASGQLASGSVNSSLVPTDVDWLPATPVSTVRSGSQHSCAISGPDVWCWGDNSYGQLGDGTSTKRNTPVKVTGLPAGQPEALQVAANRSCVVIQAEAWCWGSGTSGLLGDGSETHRRTPAKVQNLPGAVTWLAVSANHMCAVSEGKAYCWGIGASYRLGNGTQSNSAVPLKVAGLPAGKTVAAVYTGVAHSCAVIGEAAELWCWGDYDVIAQSPARVAGLSGVKAVTAFNKAMCAVDSKGTWCGGYGAESGQLGDGKYASSLSPVPVSGLEGRNVLELTGSSTTVCALTDDFSVWCWGNNGSGQVGNGTTAHQPVAYRVALEEKVTSVGTGATHTVAVTNGAFMSRPIPAVTDAPVDAYPVFSWGSGNSGKLGNGSKMSAPVPQPADWTPPSPVSRVAAGTEHSCAIAGSEVWCWGENSYGKLGDGTRTDRLSPEKVKGLPEGQPSQIQTAANVTCVLVKGEAWCWGYNGAGQLGNGGTADTSLPVKVSGLSNATALSLNGLGACAVSGGKAWCWGSGADYRLGSGTTTASLVPIEVKGFPLGKPVSGIAAGQSHTCATVGEAAEVYCWGNVGSATFTFATKVKDLQGVTALAAGYQYTCAISAGTTWCWGLNSAGQLGDGTTTTRGEPVAVNATVAARDIAVGSSTTCILDATGAAWCWGNNNSYQIGNGGTTNSLSPVAVSGMPGGRPVTAIAPGSTHTLAVSGGTFSPTVIPSVTDEDLTLPVNGWGLNTSYQLATGNTSSSTIPVPANWVPGKKVSQVVAGGSHACALVEGEAWCWGSGASYRLGNGTTASSGAPVKVAGAWTGKVARLSSQTDSTCALTDAGEVWCWGSNSGGQLGQGNTNPYTSPVKVSLPAAATMVSVGNSHACAVVGDGDLYCWGYNFYKQSAPSSTATVNLPPTQVTGFPLSTPKVSAVAVGTNYTCAVVGEAAELYCWGSNAAGLGNGAATNNWPSPTGQRGVKLLESGQSHTCAVTGEGLSCFGDGANGKLGYGTGASSSKPVAVPAMAGKNVTAMSLSSYNTCALTDTGTAWCWGYNINGQLGDGTTTTSTAPLQVSGLQSPGPVTSIASGTNFTVAAINGKVLPTTYPAVKDASLDGYPVNGWGLNTSYQLGTGTTVSASTPAPADWKPEGPVSQVVAGGLHACALVEGEVWCWGYGASYRLGNGTTASSGAPVKVAGAWTGKVARLSTQSDFTCALTDAGEVWCWGQNVSGQLGQGNTTSYTLPVKVSLPAAATMVAAGSSHACAVVGDGDLYCWGNNSYKQSAPSSAATANLGPTQVTGFPLSTPKVSAVSVGSYYTCAVVGEAAELYCWGSNPTGLGNGAGTNNWPSPTGQRGVKLLESGQYHTCAVTGEGLSCFGEGTNGKLGNGTSASSSKPVAVPAMAGKNITALSLSGNNTCALTDTGTAWCWGYNINGQLGDGTTTTSTAPLQVSGLQSPGPVTSIASGTNFTVAAINGKVLPTTYPAVKDASLEGYPLVGWGKNASYQLGTGTTATATSPVPADWKPEGEVVSAAAGGDHSCVVAGNDLYCWGHNGNGQVGNNTKTNQASPALVGSGYKQVAAYASSTCAVKADDSVWCWGQNTYGQLGNKTNVDSAVPVKVANIGPASGVSVGASFACAALQDGNVWCWGYASNRQLGNNSTTHSNIPVQATGVTGAERISAGAGHVCAGTSSAVYCWGNNVVGGPTAVPQIAGTVSDVAAGTSYSCAVVDGSPWCWGVGTSGQLGNGAKSTSSVPVRVVDMPANDPVTRIDAMGTVTCAVTVSGEMRCWGTGGLGDGTSTDSPRPVQPALPVGMKVRIMEVGVNHTLTARK